MPAPQPASAPAAPEGAPRHIPVLDAWRGLAIVLLLVGHFGRVPYANYGRLGVELFFVLSGFLMGGMLFVKREPLGRFYRRRVARIFPTAYTFLVICLLMGYARKSDGSLNWPGVASCFGFYVNYYWALTRQDPGLPAGHFWSLCVEEHAYILLSLFALAARRWACPPLLLLAAGAIYCLAATVWLGTQLQWDYYSVYWRSDTRAFSIIAGAVAACLAARGAGSRPAYFGFPSWLIGAGLFAAGVLSHYYGVRDVFRYSVGTATLAAALLFASQHVGARERAFVPLVWCGTLSYSLYIWQQPFFMAKQDGRLSTAAALSGAVLAGLASYVLVERPARRWLNARWARAPRPGPHASG